MIFALEWAVDDTGFGAGSASTRAMGSSGIDGSTGLASSASAWFEMLKASTAAARMELSTEPKGNFKDGYLGGGALRRAR
jgi:hypothetical protein